MSKTKTARPQLTRNIGSVIPCVADDKSKQAGAPPLHSKLDDLGRSLPRRDGAGAWSAPKSELAVSSPAVASTPGEGGYAVGETIDAPLGLMVEDPWQAREFYSAEEVDEMGQSLQADGQDMPCAAYFEDGRLWVFDGVKRLKGARVVGLQSLRVEIKEKPESPLHIYLASRRMNLVRSPQGAMDDAMRWQRLLEEKIVASQSELARHLGVTEGYVSQVLALSKIPRPLVLYMRERPTMKDSTKAYKIATIFSATNRATRTDEELIDIGREIVDEIQEKQLSRPEIDRLLDRKFGEPKKRAQADSRKLRIGDRDGVVKSFPSKGKFEFSVSGLSGPQLDLLDKKFPEVLASIFDEARGAAGGS